MDIGIIVTIGVGVVTLVAMLGSIFYWAGRLSNRLDEQGRRIDALAERLGAMEVRLGERMEVRLASGRRVAVGRGQRLDGRMDALGQRLDGRIDALGVEVATTRREIVAVISSHGHDTDGTITFRIPPPP